MEIGNLEDVVADDKELLPWSLRMKLAHDISKGMAYLHSVGVIHRDLASKVCLYISRHCMDLIAFRCFRLLKDKHADKHSCLQWYWTEFYFLLISRMCLFHVKTVVCTKQSLQTLVLPLKYHQGNKLYNYNYFSTIICKIIWSSTKKIAEKKNDRKWNAKNSTSHWQL